MFEWLMKKLSVHNARQNMWLRMEKPQTRNKSTFVNRVENSLFKITLTMEARHGSKI
jgi:hypothetical protein